MGVVKEGEGCVESARTHRFKPFPFLVAFFRYLSVAIDRKVHKKASSRTLWRSFGSFFVDKDRKVHRVSLLVDFRIFCYSAKNARKKANKGFHPLTPLRSRRPFMAVGGSFVLQKRRRRGKPRPFGWWVIFFASGNLPHHGCVVGKAV